jgi:hypothetical protein
VAILINNNLSFTVEAESRDVEENVLLLRCNIGGDNCIIGAIYGPNNYDNNFFEYLQREIIALGNFPKIIGGDWNMTYSNLPIDVNPDCCNMRNVPNLRHTELLLNLCNELQMSDPFRALYPTKIDFSYNPRRADAVNRSRIDFFIISDDILNSIDDCYILENLQSSLFDHKAVNLTFSGHNNRGNKVASISNKILKDPDSSLIVDIACKEAYIIYQDRPNQEKDSLLRKIGQCRKLLREAGPCFNFYGLEDDGEDREERHLQREQKINMVNDLRFQEDLCAVLDLPTNIEPDFFFDMLINHVKNELVSYQCFIFSFLRREKNALLDTLKMLKSDYANNLVLIQETEHQLKNLSEREIERAL